MDTSNTNPGLQNDLPAPAQAGPPTAIPELTVQNLPANPALAPQVGTPQAPATDAVAGNSPDSPGVAEDVDLIEKEWVIKAKAIVDKTKDDPNKQNQDINKFKADYLKRRYSKDIKVSES